MCSELDNTAAVSSVSGELDDAGAWFTSIFGESDGADMSRNLNKKYCSPSN